MDRLQQIFDIIAKDGFADKVLQEINLQKGTVPDVKKNELLMKPKTKSALGDCCWAAYLKDGSLRENSPNSCYLH